MSNVDSMGELSCCSPIQWAYVSETLYPPILLVTKISVCVQLQRLLVPLRNKTYWAVLCFIWINISYYICVIFITVFQCKPIASIWDPEIKGSCLDFKEFILATAVFNLVTDIVIWSFPFFQGIDAAHVDKEEAQCYGGLLSRGAVSDSDDKLKE